MNAGQRLSSPALHDDSCALAKQESSWAAHIYATFISVRCNRSFDTPHVGTAETALVLAPSLQLFYARSSDPNTDWRDGARGATWSSVIDDVIPGGVGEQSFRLRPR